MKKIYISVLLLSAISPAFGLPAGGEIGGGIIGGEIVGSANSCGCSNWPAAADWPDGIDSICSSCKVVNQSDFCIEGQICDDGNTGNQYGVIVGTKPKLIVNCGTWVPEFKEPSGIIRAGYWSVEPSASCEDIVTYKCGSGYYGTPGSAIFGCTRCPSFTPVSGFAASESPRTSITNCYIKANSRTSDETGNFTFTDACFYNN